MLGKLLGSVGKRRTDLYSLGCVAYWVLTGRVVFEGNTVMQMIADHVHARPAPPSERTDQEIPQRLEEIVLSCLEKDPDRRSQTADALSEMLHACEMPAQWTSDRAHQWWDTNAPQAIVDRTAELL